MITLMNNSGNTWYMTCEENRTTTGDCSYYFEFKKDGNNYTKSFTLNNNLTGETLVRYNEFYLSGVSFDFDGLYTYYVYENTSSGTLLEKGICKVDTNKIEKGVYKTTTNKKTYYKQ